MNSRRIDMPGKVHAPLPKGILPLLETPFDEKRNIDDESLTSLIEDVIRGGVHGLMAPLVASEVHALSLQEREQIVSLCAKIIDHRVPFVVGASSEKIEECRQLAALAERVAAEAYLVAVPTSLYGRPDDILHFFKSIVSATAIPLVIQDLQWGSSGLDVATIRRLKENLPSLVGMKIETVPAGPKYTLIRQEMGESFYILGGWAITQLIEALDRGVDGMVPESAMVRVFVAIYKEYAAGRRSEAVRIFRRLAPVLIFSNQEIYHSIAFFKRLLVRKGIVKHSTMRSPGYSWDVYNLRIADELIEYYLELEEEFTG
jgi:4-hydroxy-tetrahydrodipicolinate synthase